MPGSVGLRIHLSTFSDQTQCLHLVLFLTTQITLITEKPAMGCYSVCVCVFSKLYTFHKAVCVMWGQGESDKVTNFAIIRTCVCFHCPCLTLVLGHTFAGDKLVAFTFLLIACLQILASQCRCFLVVLTTLCREGRCPMWEEFIIFLWINKLTSHTLGQCYLVCFHAQKAPVAAYSLRELSFWYMLFMYVTVCLIGENVPQSLLHFVVHCFKDSCCSTKKSIG